ncbi:MAG: hypothetical protein DRI44_08115 [Chlamydiae bacterium]|nr:MAG: hypothetical protein DRI44_08115 [Chlamydiota bacterium]
MKTIFKIFLLISTFISNVSCADNHSQIVKKKSENPIYLFDVTGLINVNQTDVEKKWDTAHLLAAIQGIVNRDEPTLFIRFMKDTDDFWWNQLRQNGEWLDGRQVVKFKKLKQLLNHFRSDFKGVVVYDPKVPATCNLASTIAGVEDRLPLRYDKSKDSIYSMVMKMNYYKDVKKLINNDGSSMFTGKGFIPGTTVSSSGSAKNDVYLWGKINYIDKGLCSKEYMAYYIDSYWLKEPGEFSKNTLFNHDIFISQKAFFFDLDPWEDEAPVDDPNQKPGTDSATMKKLLKSFNKASGNKIFTIAGFTPWDRKYTDFGKSGGKHGGVATEWHYAKIISEYNGVMDADAPGLNGMVNASFYSHYPLKDYYEQNKKPTVEDLKKKGYISANGDVKQMAFVLVYMGDYDSAAWMNRIVPNMWKDPEHGKIIGTWAFNPNLSYRVPHVFDYVRTHKSSNDWFMSGDSGAGYLNPGMLLKKNRKNGLPDAIDKWKIWNKKYFKKFDLEVTGFIIDGASPGQNSACLDAYKEFSPVGIIGQKLPAFMGIHKNMPYIKMATDLPGNSFEAGKRIAGMTGIKPAFLPVRTVLKTPTWHAEMMRSAQENSQSEIAFVDPYTFFTLLKIHLKSINNTAGKAKKYVYWSHGRCDELSPISFNDGIFEIKEYDNVKTVYQSADDVQYIYFQIENGFAKKFANGKHDAEIQITLFDNKKGKVGITYDGIQDGESKAYIDLENYKYLKGKKKWTKITFKLKTPLFKHRENGNTDFRLINFGTDLIIKNVVIKQK